MGPDPNATDPPLHRTTAFGQTGSVTFVDQFGVWLSKRQIRRAVGPLEGRDIIDVGCGFEATLVRNVLNVVKSAIVLDLALDPGLSEHPKVRAVEGLLPGALREVPDASVDVALCMSVVEHLWDPNSTLKEMRRVLRPGGVCAVNVPSWRGKRALEFSAFRLGLSPAAEMNDHKMYYDPRDLWPLMVRAGFVPQGIRCFRHKFGLNTFAVATVDSLEHS